MFLIANERTNERSTAGRIINDAEEMGGTIARRAIRSIRFYFLFRFLAIKF